MAQQRFEHDRYDSPSWFATHTASLIRLQGTFGEPCCGGNPITEVLQALGMTGWTNDIDPYVNADYHCDVTHKESWELFPDADWIITNPPYGRQAFSIVKNAYEHANNGIIFFLRTTWDEPCDNRAKWLWEHPITAKFVYPRFKFRKNIKNQWSSDACTIAAFIWCKYPDEEIFYTKERFISVPKNKICQYYDNPDSRPLFSYKTLEVYTQGILSYYNNQGEVH